MFKFITGRPLWINILFALILSTIIVMAFLFSLNYITRHGSTVTIPSVTGKTFNEARKFLVEQGFDVEIQDSVYIDTARATVVLKQFPEADEVVKTNRTVYLTINKSVPPSIEMPTLEGLTYRNVLIILKQYGLKLGDTTYRQDIGRDNVLEQLYNGNRIKPKTKITMGASIDLVLGAGIGSEEFNVPDLFGKSFYEAKIYLESLGLIALPIPDPGVVDTMDAFVYRQNPEHTTADRRFNRIRPGEVVDVFISKEKRTRQEVDSLPSIDQ